MFGLTYLSTEDRLRLDQLREQIAAATGAEFTDLNQKIQEIESRRKALGDCTYEECSELKHFLFQKYQKLMGVGKKTMARNFMMMMRQIDGRMIVLQREAAIKAAEQRQLQTQAKGKKDGKSRVVVPTKRTENRWSIPLAGPDDDD